MTGDSVVTPNHPLVPVLVQQWQDELETLSPPRSPRSTTLREVSPVMNEYLPYVVEATVGFTVLVKLGADYDYVTMVIGPSIVSF